MHEVQITFPEDVEDKGKYLLTQEQLLHRVHWRAGGTSGDGAFEQWGSDAGIRRMGYCGDDVPVQSFSSFNVHQSHGASLLKHRLLGPTPRFFD